jgi:hypothetical protein
LFPSSSFGGLSSSSSFLKTHPAGVGGGGVEGTDLTGASSSGPKPIPRESVPPPPPLPRAESGISTDGDDEYLLERDQAALQMQADDEDTLEQEEAQQRREGVISVASAQQGRTSTAMPLL